MNFQNSLLPFGKIIVMNTFADLSDTAGAPKFKIAIIEDNGEIREILTDHFRRSKQFECILSCDTVDKFVKYYRGFMQIDILLLDLMLYGTSSVTELPKLRRLVPDMKIIIHSVIDTETMVKRTFALSADGYITKELPPELLEDKLFAFLNNEAPAVSPKVVNRLIEAARGSGVSSTVDLSPVEKAIVTHIIEGHDNESIGQLMDMGVNGVKYHIKRINKKFNTKNRVQLISRGKQLLDVTSSREDS